MPTLRIPGPGLLGYLGAFAGGMTPGITSFFKQRLEKQQGEEASEQLRGFLSALYPELGEKLASLPRKVNIKEIAPFLVELVKQAREEKAATEAAPYLQEAIFPAKWFQQVLQAGIPGMAKEEEVELPIPPDVLGQPQVSEMIEQGNINLSARPRVVNPDGSISTVRSMSVNIEGKETLIPTVSPGGRMLSDQEAIDLYRQTGQHLGKFSSIEAANRYAKALHESEAAKVGRTMPRVLGQAQGLFPPTTTRYEYQPEVPEVLSAPINLETRRVPPTAAGQELLSKFLPLIQKQMETGAEQEQAAKLSEYLASRGIKIPPQAGAKYLGPMAAEGLKQTGRVELAKERIGGQRALTEYVQGNINERALEQRLSVQGIAQDRIDAYLSNAREERETRTRERDLDRQLSEKLTRVRGDQALMRSREVRASVEKVAALQREFQQRRQSVDQLAASLLSIPPEKRTEADEAQIKEIQRYRATGILQLLLEMQGLDAIQKSGVGKELLEKPLFP